MPESTLRDRLAEAIWNASRADEGTISATGANVVADALLPTVEQYAAERMAEVVLSRAELADEAERLRNHLAGLADLNRAVSAVTPCACSAQRARAEAAEATLREVRALCERWAKPPTALTAGERWENAGIRSCGLELRAILDREGGEPC